MNQCSRGKVYPIDKAEGDTIYAATVNANGVLRVRAQSIGKDTVL